ncbi:MAG: hypothetical protein WCG91_03055 [Candidatus Shapirobacteria bacterium]
MKERLAGNESSESKTVSFVAFIDKLAEKQEVLEIKPDVLKKSLEDFGANFEDLSEENKKNLSMYAQKNRNKALEKIWGNKFTDYKDWVETYIQEYEERTGKQLPRMKNAANLKNEDKEPSYRKDLGMISFLGDLTAYASGDLNFEDFKLILGTRAENGAIKAMSKEERGGRESKPIEWDRELEEGKESVLKDPSFHPKTGELIPFDKQVFQPASFPPEFPTEAFIWLSATCYVE